MRLSLRKARGRRRQQTREELHLLQELVLSLREKHHVHSALVEDRKSVALVNGQEEFYLLVERVDGGGVG